MRTAGSWNRPEALPRQADGGPPTRPQQRLGLFPSAAGTAAEGKKTGGRQGCRDRPGPGNRENAAGRLSASQRSPFPCHRGYRRFSPPAKNTTKGGKFMRYRRKLFGVKHAFDTRTTEDLFVLAMRENCQFHYDHCAPYRRILQHYQFSPDGLTGVDDLARLPCLPTLLFKRHRLYSLPRRRMLIRATSSGTSGQFSEIGFEPGGFALRAGNGAADRPAARPFLPRSLPLYPLRLPAAQGQSHRRDQDRFRRDAVHPRSEPDLRPPLFQRRLFGRS